jgi:hypothetical protein
MTMYYGHVEYFVGRSTLCLILGDDHLRVMGSHLFFFCHDLQQTLISVTGRCVDRDPPSFLTEELIRGFLQSIEKQQDKSDTLASQAWKMVNSTACIFSAHARRTMQSAMTVGLPSARLRRNYSSTGPGRLSAT